MKAAWLVTALALAAAAPSRKEGPMKEDGGQALRWDGSRAWGEYKEFYAAALGPRSLGEMHELDGRISRWSRSLYRDAPA